MHWTVIPVDDELIDRTNALLAIQKLHKPYQPTSTSAIYCVHCFEDGGYDGALYVLYPCETRKLADEGLADQGEINE